MNSTCQLSLVLVAERYEVATISTTASAARKSTLQVSHAAATSTSTFCLASLFSGNHSRFGRIPGRSLKEPLVIADARFFTDRMPFPSPSQQHRTTSASEISEMSWNVSTVFIAFTMLAVSNDIWSVKASLHQSPKVCYEDIWLLGLTYGDHRLICHLNKSWLYACELYMPSRALNSAQSKGDGSQRQGLEKVIQ